MDHMTYKMDHVTLTTPLLRVICHLCACTWHSPCTKFDHSSFSHSRDIVDALQKFKWFTWPDHAPFRDDLYDPPIDL